MIASLWYASMSRIDVLPTVSLKLISKEPQGEIAPIMVDAAISEIFSFVVLIWL